MYEETELPNLPQWLQKDIVTMRHEVPIAGGESGTRFDEFYSPRLVRWAIESWLNHVPAGTGTDAAALQRALLEALSDGRSFRAYLRLPEAFRDAYQDELLKSNERRNELLEMKRLLDQKPRVRLALLLRAAGVAVCLAAAVAVLSALR